MITLAALCTVGWSVVGQGEAATPMFPAPYGPLRLVNQQPVQLLFLQPFPDRADVTPFQQVEVDLNTALTNTLVGDQQDFTVHLNLEMVRTVIALRYGMYPNLEVGLYLPLIYTYSGILDHFILGVERLLTPGRERSLRKNQDAGSFTYQVSRGNRVFIQGQDDAFGIGDILLQTKAHLLHEQGWVPAVSLRAAVKFPSGDADRA
jgi:hypothetical protein